MLTPDTSTRAGAPADGAALTESVIVSAFGIPVRVDSNSADVITAVRDSFEPWKTDNGPPPSGIHLTVVSQDDAGDTAHDRRLEWDYPDRDTVHIRGRGLTATLSMGDSRGTARIERSFLAPRHEIRHTVLDGMILTLLNQYDRHPVHAAALRMDDVALLLHGPSGVGKSTLAYTAHRHGMSVLADDAVRIQLEPELRVWGRGQRVHLRPDVRAHFPELGDHDRIVRATGGPDKLAVDVQGPMGLAPPFVRSARVCLLDRRDGGHGGLVRATPDEIQRALMDSREARADRNPERRAIVTGQLAAPGGWRLQLSKDPTASVGYLRDMLLEIRRTDS